MFLQAGKPYLETVRILGVNRGAAMKTLRVLTVGALFAAVAGLSFAADEPTAPALTTITVTAKRIVLTPAVERVAPQEVIDAALLIGDMPEAEIDYHVTPIVTPVVALPKSAGQPVLL
jgi:hypothetical protein